MVCHNDTMDRGRSEGGVNDVGVTSIKIDESFHLM